MHLSKIIIKNIKNFTYDELYDLLDAVLDASSLDEVIDASNRMMANHTSFNTKW